MSSDPGPLSTRSAKLDIIPKGQKSLSKDPDQRAAVCIQRQLLRFGASSAVFGGSASRSRSGGASSSGPPPRDAHGSLDIGEVCLAGYSFEATRLSRLWKKRLFGLFNL